MSASKEREFICKPIDCLYISIYLDDDPITETTYISVCKTKLVEKRTRADFERCRHYQSAVVHRPEFVLCTPCDNMGAHKRNHNNLGLSVNWRLHTPDTTEKARTYEVTIDDKQSTGNFTYLGRPKSRMSKHGGLFAVCLLAQNPNLARGTGIAKTDGGDYICR